MKHVSILALHDATLNSIDSSYQIFSRVNDFMKYQKKPPFYNVQIVGLTNTATLGNGLYSIRVHQTIDAIEQTDVIVIPLLCGDFALALWENRKYHEWLTAQYNKNAEIVCLCVGSFFLASTGLLDNRKCAVHWAARDEFSSMFPQVKIIDDTIITDENRIYTSGGGYSYLTLLLYLLEKHLGRDIAILASKMFEIDMSRQNQYPFTIFMGQKRHGDEVILAAQDYIEKAPTQAVTIDELCAKFGMGRRTFERRFRKCTGNSVTEYVQRVKVEVAKNLLESSGKTVNEIIYETGYNDIDAFRKVFKRFTDLSPTDYRKKYLIKV